MQGGTHVLAVSVGKHAGSFTVRQRGPTSVQFGSPAFVGQFGPVRVQDGAGQVAFPACVGHAGVGQFGPLWVQLGVGHVAP
jgi:hypothetical protein